MTPAAIASLMMITSGAAHATVNAVLKSGKDKMSSRALIDGFSALIVLPLAFFLPLPSHAWAWLAASGAIHLVYLTALIKAFESACPGQSLDYTADDSTAGIFLHGFREQLHPQDLHVMFLKDSDQGKEMELTITGTYLKNDAKNPAAPPQRVTVNAFLRVAQPSEVDGL